MRIQRGMPTVVPDPCPSNFSNSTIVANMCMSSSATEENNNGNFTADSVVLRIRIQQDNCICRVTIDNQMIPISIGMGKYNDLVSSAPEYNECGLAIDITHIPKISTGNGTAPIECTENVDYRTMHLLKNGSLEFKSRIRNGNFTRGYCIRIVRDINSDPTQVLQIDCNAPTTTEQTTENIKTTDPTKSSPQTTESVKSTTNSSTIDTTTSDNSTNIKHQPITTATDSTTGIEQTTYIGIGAGSGVALILLVVLVVICLRRKSSHKAGTNGDVNKSYQQEDSDDRLQDNVLYVPSEEFDITGDNYSTVDVDTGRSSSKRLIMEGNYSNVDEDMPKSSNKRLSMEGDYNTVDEDTRKSPNERLSVEGNYSTVDEDTRKSPNERLRLDGNYSTVKLDAQLHRNCSYPENSERGQTKGQQKPTIKPKPKSSCKKSEDNRSSDQNIKHITPLNGSDNVYAVVDKTSKNALTTSESKGEGTCQPEQTYAVVDKARKRKSSSDETNKKKFEINSGNR